MTVGKGTRVTVSANYNSDVYVFSEDNYGRNGGFSTSKLGDGWTQLTDKVSYEQASYNSCASKTINGQSCTDKEGEDVSISGMSTALACATLARSPALAARPAPASRSTHAH